MGLYVKSNVTFQVASDSSLNDARANWAETSTHATTGSYADTEIGTTYTIADSATQVIAFGPITTAHSLFIKSDRQVVLKFNGDSTGVTLGDAAAVGGFCVIAGGSNTSLSITNSSGASASVDVQLVGV